MGTFRHVENDAASRPSASIHLLRFLRQGCQIKKLEQTIPKERVERPLLAETLFRDPVLSVKN